MQSLTDPEADTRMNVRTHTHTAGILWLYLLYVVEVVYFRGEASVNAEELLIHERGQGKAVKRVHTGVVHLL